MKNLLLEKLQKNEKTLGTFHELLSPAAVECLAYGGYDYVVIDTEHGPGDVETTLQCIRAAKGQNLTPLVRVKDSSRNSILKMFDVGAMGLIIPNLRSVEEAKEIISHGKYFPVGERGVAPTAGSNFWSKDYAKQGMDHYFSTCNREQLLIPQCETVGCLENLEEIVSLDGIDGIFVGPYDLSTAMGIPGQFDKPEFKAAIQKILDTCKKYNKFSFIYAGTVEAARHNFELGYQSVTLGMDAISLIEASKQTVQKCLG